MSDENNNGRNPAPGGRQPLTLKPRGAGSVSAGTVKQSFSHGRSKTVVVETKRARTHLPGGGNLAAPSSAEKRLFEPRPAPAPAPRAPGAPNDGLSAEEPPARWASKPRTTPPRPTRRDDRASTTTYRPAPPSARFEGANFGQRAPRPDDQRPVRDDRGPPRDRDDRAPRAAPGGDTVRYSA